MRNLGGGNPAQTALTPQKVTVLKCGQILDMVNPNQFGGIAYLWAVPGTQGGFGSITKTYLQMYDAMTGTIHPKHRQRHWNEHSFQMTAET